MPFITEKTEENKIKAANYKLGVFYQSISCTQPLEEELTKKLVNSINQDIMVAIINERNRAKLSTKFKHKVVKFLIKFKEKICFQNK